MEINTMTFSVLIKQPWFQALLGILIFTSLIIGVYFYGKSHGRSQAGTEFDKRQETLLKQSQAAIQKADQYKAIADSNELYAEQLRKVAAAASDKARENETRITGIYNIEQKEIKDKYEVDKNYIASDLSLCDRCRDLCERSNKLTTYGPEFASAKCDASVDCASACSTGNP